MPNRLISRIQAPALPVPPSGDPSEYLSSLNNILRLFFNLTTGALNLVIGSNGGRFLEKPNGLFFSTTDQPIAVAGTAQVVSFENTYLTGGMSINGGSDSQITVTYSGVYNFQFTAQLESSSASTKNVHLWISRDGVDVGYSAKHVILQGSSDITTADWNFNIDLQAGSYIEMKWVSDDIDTSLHAEAPSSPVPGEPSAVIAVTFVSVLPETLPTPP